MRLHINGEQHEFPDGLSVAALVAQLGMKPDRVAVELNLEIVPRTLWEMTTLKDGDKLEVVHFVGGGSAGPSDLAQQELTAAPEPAAGVEWECKALVLTASFHYVLDIYRFILFLIALYAS